MRPVILKYLSSPWKKGGTVGKQSDDPFISSPSFTSGDRTFFSEFSNQTFTACSLLDFETLLTYLESMEHFELCFSSKESLCMNVYKHSLECM